MTSEDPKVRQQGCADKRKHVTLTVTQKLGLELLKAKESLWLYAALDQLWYKEMERPVVIIYSIK
jgi:hypothetical protein